MKVIKNNLLLRLSGSSGLMDCLSDCSFNLMESCRLWIFPSVESVASISISVDFYWCLTAATVKQSHYHLTFRFSMLNSDVRGASLVQKSKQSSSHFEGKQSLNQPLCGLALSFRTIVNWMLKDNVNQFTLKLQLSNQSRRNGNFHPQFKSFWPNFHSRSERSKTFVCLHFSQDILQLPTVNL